MKNKSCLEIRWTSLVRCSFLRKHFPTREKRLISLHCRWLLNTTRTTSSSWRQWTVFSSKSWRDGAIQRDSSGCWLSHTPPPPERETGSHHLPVLCATVRKRAAHDSRTHGPATICSTDALRPRAGQVARETRTSHHSFCQLPHGQWDRTLRYHHEV